ncbi:methyltransferase domain-containing protein [Nocardiopsis algeriensis]|uniref:methyltransferase domain-containing protein n=1 Tax=Nocardiopsis algeriensis TaxID=1478215 RepID=UPI00161C3093
MGSADTARASEKHGLVRLLAERAEQVHGIDADPGTLARARELTGDDPRVHLTLGSAPEDLPPGPFDAITCVAALHHLPFAPALEHMRSLLAPGAPLIVVGIYRTASPLDYATDAVAIPANLAMGWIRNRGRTSSAPVSMTAPTRRADMTLSDIARQVRCLLPGARLRRRLFWRYTLVWRRTGTPVPPPGAEPRPRT